MHIAQNVKLKQAESVQEMPQSQIRVGTEDHRQLARTSPKIAQLQAYQNIARATQVHGNPIQGLASQGGLPEKLQSGIESLSGIAMNDVRVHYNSSKPAQLQAHAYAQGTDIHLAPGQEKHLGHEAWHVVQQKQGRVKPTLQLKGVAVNDDSALEREADVMGAKALGLGTQPTDRNLPALNLASASNPVQRYVIDEKDGRWSKADILANHADKINTPAKVTLLETYIASLNGYALAEVVDAIAADRAPAVKYPTVNDVGKLDVGCTVCVLADFLGITAKQVLQSAVGKPALMQTLMKIYKVQGGPEELMVLLKAYDIVWDIESIDNLAALQKSLAETGDEFDYDGAVAWEGHIIRIKGSGSRYTMWDPQSNTKNCLPPANTALKVIYFKWT